MRQIYNEDISPDPGTPEQSREDFFQCFSPCTYKKPLTILLPSRLVLYGQLVFGLLHLVHCICFGFVAALLFPVSTSKNVACFLLSSGHKLSPVGFTFDAFPFLLFLTCLTAACSCICLYYISFLCITYLFLLSHFQQLQYFCMIVLYVPIHPAIHCYEEDN